MEKLTETIDTILGMSLEELGFTPDNGGEALYAFKYKDRVALEKEAYCPRISKEDVNQARIGSAKIPSHKRFCREKIHKCHEILRSLKKITAGDILIKWCRFDVQQIIDCKRGGCAMRCFLLPPMHKLLDALIKKGAPHDYIKAIPASENILAFKVNVDANITPASKCAI